MTLDRFDDDLPRYGMDPAAKERTHLAVMSQLMQETAVRSRWSRPIEPLTTAGRRRWALAAACAVAAAVSGITLIGAPSEAAWASVPRPLLGNRLTGPASSCSQELTKVPRRGLSPGATPAPVLAEQRGTTTSVLMMAPGVVGVCIGTASTRLAGLSPTTRSDHNQLVIDAQPGIMTGPDATRVLAGRVPAQAAKVVVVTVDRRVVNASLARGAFLAWWPSAADPVTVTAYRADGSKLQEVTPVPSNPSGLAPAPVRSLRQLP